MKGCKCVCVCINSVRVCVFASQGTNVALITATYRVRGLPFPSTLTLPLTYPSFTSLPFSYFYLFFFTSALSSFSHYPHFWFFLSIAYLAFTPSSHRLVWRVAPRYQTPLSQHLTSPLPSPPLSPMLSNLFPLLPQLSNRKWKYEEEIGDKAGFHIICITCTRYRVSQRDNLIFNAL